MHWLLAPRRARSWLGLRAWRALPLPLVALAWLTLASTALAAESIRITAPTAGAVVPGPDVTITVDVGAIKLVPGSQAAQATDRHIHYLLDVDPAPYLDGKRAVPTGDPNIVHSAEASHTFKDLKPGPHKVTILLTDANHMAVQPVVDPSVRFTIASQNATSLPRTGGAPGSILGTAAAAGVALLALGLAIRWRSSGSAG